MADLPLTTDQGIQADVPPESEHLPGAPDPDASEPQIPRVASPGVGPGDVASTGSDEPVTPGRAADARVGEAEGGETLSGADGRPVMATMRQPVQQQQAQGPTGQGVGEAPIEGPGYPAEDMDDEDDLDGDEDEGLLSDDEDDGRDDEFSEVADIDADVQAVAPPELGDAPIEDEDGDTSILGDGHADKAAWNRRRIAAMQDTEAEPDVGDTFGSQAVLGHGDTPDVLSSDLSLLPGGRTPGSSEDMGYGGGAPSEDVDPDVPGLDTGDGRLDELTEGTNDDAQDQLEDAADALDDDTNDDLGTAGAPGRQARADDADVRAQLSPSSPGTGHGGGGYLGHADGDASPEALDRMALGEEVGAFRDDSVLLSDGTPFLPEHRDFLDGGMDDDIPLEERLLDGGGEDPSFALGETGFAEDLEMEDLNETDDISNRFEDQRVADDSMDGNEERTQTRD